MTEAITVITFTLRRPELLNRCVRSVAKSECEIPVKHLIVGKYVRELKTPFDDFDLTFTEIENELKKKPIGEEMAKLRSDILQDVDTSYCAFLDDDNTVERDHFSSLIEVIKSKNCQFAFSHRKVYEQNGKPFKGDRYPWYTPGSTERKIYEWCVAKSVITKNHNIIKDGPISDDTQFNVSTVDMNEWLFSTNHLKDIGFDISFTREDHQNNVGEDDKLLQKILKTDSQFSSSYLATLNYYLGGNSNF